MRLNRNQLANTSLFKDIEISLRAETANLRKRDMVIDFIHKETKPGSVRCQPCFAILDAEELGILQLFTQVPMSAHHNSYSWSPDAKNSRVFLKWLISGFRAQH